MSDDLISDLKAYVRVLQRRALAAEPDALRCIRMLPEFAKSSTEELTQNLQRRHCFAAAARQLGFRNWAHASAVLLGEDSSDFGTLLYPANCSGHSNIWSAHYSEAREIRAAHGGYLLAYRRHFLIVESYYLDSLGCAASDPDWELISRDWVQPTSFEARARLYRQLVQNALVTHALQEAPLQL